ncbi:MAG: DUF4399 domain-containing protein [Gammaproteobacteria bacterium]|nr:DUF4399 domain-containing protein [Gammaproteobacteria bacterium]
MRRLLPLALTLSMLALPAAAEDKSGTSFKDKAKAAAQSDTAKNLKAQGLAKIGMDTTPSPAGAKAYFIEPKNGAEVTTPVRVVFGLSGMGVAPAGTQKENTGHHHVLIDEPAVDPNAPLPANDQVKHFGGGQTETTLELKPGKHTLQLVLGDWKHQPHNPAVASEKIAITVK